MAKPATIKIRLNSTADTGFFYVTRKNTRNQTREDVDAEVRPSGPKARGVPGREDQVGFPYYQEPELGMLFHGSRGGRASPA